eukprot:47195_1
MSISLINRITTKRMSHRLKHNYLKKHNINYKYQFAKRPYFKISSNNKFISKSNIINKNIIYLLPHSIKPKYIIHFGNFLAIAAMLQSEMLYLRGFMICASACGIAFNLLQPVPLKIPAYWGLFFIFTHAIQIYYLLQDKFPTTNLPDNLKQIYK